MNEISDSMSWHGRESNYSVASEIEALITYYDGTPESWILKHLQSRIEAVDPDLKSKQPHPASVLGELVDLGLPFDGPEYRKLAILEIEVGSTQVSSACCKICN